MMERRKSEERKTEINKEKMKRKKERKKKKKPEERWKKGGGGGGGGEKGIKKGNITLEINNRKRADLSVAQMIQNQDWNYKSRPGNISEKILNLKHRK